MSASDIQKKVLEIVAKRVEGVDIVSNGISPNSTFSDLKLDSLALIEVVMDIEDKFGIEVPDSDAAKLTDIEKVVKYIEERLEK